MEPRMKSPALTMPSTREAMLSIHKVTLGCGVPRAILELVDVRVGQINGCSVCVDMHSRLLKRLGESDQRIFSVAVWRETSYYTEAERAALALAEAATRIADRSDAVPEAVWKEAERHFDEKQLGAILLTIAMANFWNRLNVPTQQITGDWIEKLIS